jgi:cobalt transport protein ATP-binding subunit
MIQIENLHYRYPDGTVVLKGINFTIHDGEFLLVCGPNGSGKTTFIRHLNGLLKPSRGSVLVNGRDTLKAGQDLIRQVGMVFQDADSQILQETVWEDVCFGPENLGLSPEEVRELASRALETLGIGHLRDKPCHLLSGGEKRRLAIAGVLAMEPEILIFDEPFANLDYPGVRQVLLRIVELHRRGHTILVTTHDVEKAVAHADRIAVLHEGELKVAGTPEEVIPMLSSYNVRPPCYSFLGEQPLSWLTV